MQGHGVLNLPAITGICAGRGQSCEMSLFYQPVPDPEDVRKWVSAGITARDNGKGNFCIYRCIAG